MGIISHFPIKQSVCFDDNPPWVDQYRQILLRKPLIKLRPNLMKPLLALLTLYVALFVAPSAHSCPWIGGLPDFNCDGEIIISVLGDSLVYGTLDTENDGKGGYVLRTQRSFQKATFNNFGFPGITTYGLAAKINRAFGRPKPNKLGAQLIKSDLIVLDVGRNDDWSMSPSQTASTLKLSLIHI